jgi:hypothetical protein
MVDFNKMLKKRNEKDKDKDKMTKKKSKAKDDNCLANGSKIICGDKSGNEMQQQKADLGEVNNMATEHENDEDIELDIFDDLFINPRYSLK